MDSCRNCAWAEWGSPYPDDDFRSGKCKWEMVVNVDAPRSTSGIRNRKLTGGSIWWNQLFVDCPTWKAKGGQESGN